MPLGKLYPLGYAAFDAEQRLAQLMEDERTLLIDIRYRPYSQRTAWLRNTLAASYGKRYRALGAMLGNVNYRSGQPIKLANPSAGLNSIRHLLEAGHNLVLLCACKEYAQCHRRAVVDLVKEALPHVEVIGIPSADALARPTLANYWTQPPSL